MRSERFNRPILFTIVVFLMLSGTLMFTFSEEIDETDAGYSITSTESAVKVNRDDGDGCYASTSKSTLMDGEQTVFSVDYSNSSAEYHLSLTVVDITSSSLSFRVDDYTAQSANGRYYWYLSTNDNYTQLEVDNEYDFYFNAGNSICYEENTHLGDYRSAYYSFDFAQIHKYQTIARISFDANGGSGAPTPVQQILTNQTSTSGNVSIPIPTEIPSWEGHTFIGWATGQTGQPAYQPGDTVSISKTTETTYYAQWIAEEDSFTVTTATELIRYAKIPGITINFNPSEDQNLSENLVIADGTDIIRANGKTLKLEGHSIICQGESRIELKLHDMDNSKECFGEYELSGHFTVTAEDGFLHFDGEFSGSNTVILRKSGGLFTGTLNGNMEFVNGNSVESNTNMVFEDFTVESGSTLTLMDNSNVTYSTLGYFNLYGTLNKNDNLGPKLMNVKDGSNFNTYTGSSIDTVAVRAAQDSTTASIDLSNATVDLGVYTGGTIYSNEFETYSGIDASDVVGTIYVSYGAEVSIIPVGEPYGYVNGFYQNDLNLEIEIVGSGDSGKSIMTGTVSGYGQTVANFDAATTNFDTIIICVKPMVTVTFDSNEGTEIQAQAVEVGTLIVAPDDPELYGYVFAGWFIDDGTFLNEFDFNSPIQSTITLYAKWNGDLKFTTDPISDGDVVSIDGLPGTVSFKATASKDYSSLVWDFGDGSSSTNTYATHYYSQPGIYTASLTVYNNYGSDVTTYQIEVPSADPGDDGTEWALVAAVVLIAFVSGALIARRFL